LICQDLPADRYEVIVVDDGSPEPLAPVLEPIAASAPGSVLCLRKSNGGPASARNLGASIARGDYLLFVDDDLEVDPSFARAHVELQRDYGPALVNCHMEWKIASSPAPFHRWYCGQVEEWSRQRAAHETPVSAGVSERPLPSTTTANLSLTRADFERVGGFDPGYPFGCEDQDLAGRLGRLGRKSFVTTRSIPRHVETHNTLWKVCHRQQRGAADTVRFIRRFAVPERCGEPALSIHNGPIRLGRDSLGIALRKLVREAVGSRLTRPGLEQLIAILEERAPNSRLLQRAYTLVVSSYIQRGWREGLKMHAETPVLDGWEPVP
jgi:GT2 family glycosyltransferase